MASVLQCDGGAGAAAGGGLSLPSVSDAAIRAVARLRAGDLATAVLDGRNTAAVRCDCRAARYRAMDGRHGADRRVVPVRASAHRVHLAAVHGAVRAAASAVEADPGRGWCRGGVRGGVPAVHDVLVPVRPVFRPVKLVPHLRAEPHCAGGAARVCDREPDGRCRGGDGRGRGGGRAGGCAGDGTAAMVRGRVGIDDAWRFRWWSRKRSRWWNRRRSRCLPRWRVRRRRGCRIIRLPVCRALLGTAVHRSRGAQGRDIAAAGVPAERIGLRVFDRVDRMVPEHRGRRLVSGGDAAVDDDPARRGAADLFRRVHAGVRSGRRRRTR